MVDAASQTVSMITRVVLAIILSACSRVEGPPEFKLRALHAAVAAYQSSHASLPLRIEDVCKDDPAWCRLEPADRWIRDQWGTTIRYENLRTNYRLSSAGADRRFATPDDLSFDAAEDLEMAGELAGCYRLGSPLRDLDSDRLDLSTTIARSGGYRVRSPTAIGRDTAFIAEWYPLARDSIIVRWIHVDEGVTLRAQIADRHLSGAIGSRSLAGQAVSCGDP